MLWVISRLLLVLILKLLLMLVFLKEVGSGVILVGMIWGVGIVFFVEVVGGVWIVFVCVLVGGVVLGVGEGFS